MKVLVSLLCRVLTPITAITSTSNKIPAADLHSLFLSTSSANLQNSFTKKTNTNLDTTNHRTATCTSSKHLRHVTINQRANHQSQTKRKDLVILGTGWGSYSLLKSIKKNKKLKSLYNVIVVSPRNHFLFTPLLASTTVGTLEFRSIIEPIRNAGFRDEHHFHLSHATGLDTESKVVKCASALEPSQTYALPYDILVIGVGAISNDFNVPGVKEHVFFLKEIDDARRIRNKIITNFELATQYNTSVEERERLLHFVIVGGGPTGVEFGAELNDILKQDLHRLFPDERDTVRISLIEAKDILSSFDEKLRSYTEGIIKKRSSMEIVKASVTEANFANNSWRDQKDWDSVANFTKVTASHVTLNNGQVIPCGMVVWSTGLAPREFTKSLNLEKNKQGQILVDNHFRVVGGDPHQCVYALGDCAQILDHALPCTAQVAERQGRHIGKILAHTSTTDNPLPDEFVYKSTGMLAYVGSYKAIHDTPYDKSQGFLSWILWRSAYATKLGSWRLRMQVPVDWMKAFFFGRDTSRF